MEMLKTQSVLVTGSNRGIGFEIVRQLAGKSNRPEWIFATCRDPVGSRAQELKNLAAKHQGVEIIPLDITDPTSIQAAAAKVTEKLQGAGLNLLINNAGIGKPSSLESETAEDMSAVYKANVIGPMMVSQAFLPLLRKASQESPQKGMSCRKAAIVNMSSEGGSITNVLGWDAGHVINYRCSKAALNMLTRCQALGFAEDEILCIALHPGWVQTDMGNALVGVQAPMAVEPSVQAILNTLGRLSEKDNGTFVNWEGAALPW
uniref:C-factor-like n=1 Tax=Euleptes europaea TaxID=460621 RepID=UPI0025405849|nr:C-factor-like [Euleptes europaea]